MKILALEISEVEVEMFSIKAEIFGVLGVGQKGVLTRISEDG